MIMPLFKKKKTSLDELTDKERTDYDETSERVEKATHFLTTQVDELKKAVVIRPREDVYTRMGIPVPKWQPNDEGFTHNIPGFEDYTTLTMLEGKRVLDEMEAGLEVVMDQVLMYSHMNKYEGDIIKPMLKKVTQVLDSMEFLSEYWAEEISTHNQPILNKIGEITNKTIPYELPEDIRGSDLLDINDVGSAILYAVGVRAADLADDPGLAGKMLEDIDAIRSKISGWWADEGFEDIPYDAVPMFAAIDAVEAYAKRLS